MFIAENGAEYPDACKHCVGIETARMCRGCNNFDRYEEKVCANCSGCITDGDEMWCPYVKNPGVMPDYYCFLWEPKPKKEDIVVGDTEHCKKCACRKYCKLKGTDSAKDCGYNVMTKSARQKEWERAE